MSDLTRRLNTCMLCVLGDIFLGDLEGGERYEMNYGYRGKK
jgi:hypothetical protein